MAPLESHHRLIGQRSTHRSKEARAGRAKTDAPAEETTRAKSVSGCAERVGKHEKNKQRGYEKGFFQPSIDATWLAKTRVSLIVDRGFFTKKKGCFLSRHLRKELAVSRKSHRFGSKENAWYVRASSD